MTANKTNPKLVLAVVILAGIAVATVSIFLIRHFRSTQIIVRFPDAKGLTEGSPLEYKGIRIGSVSSLKVVPGGPVEVSVKIDPDRAEHPRENALFVVSQDISTSTGPGILMGFCKEHDPAMLPRLKSGAIVDGLGSPMAFTLKTTVGCFDDVIDRFSDTLDKFKEKLNRTLQSPDLKKRFHELEQYLIDLNKKTQAEIKRFLEEKGPEMREKIDRLIRDLEAAGYPELADRLRELLEGQKIEKPVQTI